MRIDQWLVQHGLCESREKAKLEVEHQRVTINGKVVPKTSVQVSETDVVLLGDPYLKYVSKGGMKLEKALEEFMIDLTGLQVLDIGASTGGFTDCALKHGAARVVAMDVGSNQLHSSLQNHPQVLQMEQTDIREVSPDAFDTLFDVVLVDVSFISLDFVFPCLSALIKPDGRILTLIKPQFEQKERVRFRNGIIKDERVHRRVLDSSIKCAEQNGLRLVKQTTTDIGNEQKNLEFLALWKKAI